MLKNGFPFPASRIRSPAAIPQKKQETIRTASAVVPSAVLYKIS